MTKEFKVKKYKDTTVYILESATGGGTSSGSVASISNAVGGVRRRGDNLIAQEEKKEAPKPRNFVAKNAKMGGAGQHKDKKKDAKQGNIKHKSRELDMSESGYDRRDAYQRDYDSSRTGFGRRGREDDEYHNGGDYDPELERNRKETMMYNVTVDGKPVTPKPVLGRSAAIAWAKEKIAAGKLDPNAAKLSPVRYEQSMAEGWSQKYKKSINCSHPKGFSQKAHCAGKKKHNEDMTMEMTCPDCGMCKTHGNLNEIKKGAKDSNGFTKCWPGHHAVGTKKGKNGGQVRNCVPNEGVAEGSNNKCPPATQDIKLNLKNRQKAINEFGYGPLNPDMPNQKFWMKKADEWQLDNPREAKKSLCGNCAAFNQSPDMLDCIEQGIGKDNYQDPLATIEAGDLGYCEFLKFKCASRRTCDAWVTGGPITTNKKDVAEDSLDDIEDTKQLKTAIALAKSQKAIRQAKHGKDQKFYADGTPVTPQEVARRAAERKAKKQGVAEGGPYDLGKEYGAPAPGKKPLPRGGSIPRRHPDDPDFMDPDQRRLRADQARVKKAQDEYHAKKKQDVAEDHSTVGGWGKGSYDTYSGTRHGRGVAENPEWYNDEANEMSSAQLKSLYKHAIKLRQAVKKLQAHGDTLEPWQQSKVTKAADYLDAVFNAVDNEQDMDEGWKNTLAGLGLAGAMALGAGGAHARVTGDEDPSVNRLTGKPNVAQVAPDDVKKPDASLSLGSRYTQGIDYSSEPYTIKADGKDYKFAGRDADAPSAKGQTVTVPAALIGVRGLKPVKVILSSDGKYYISADLDETAPKGWEGTVKAMKKHDKIDNPWALAHWMKNKGYKSHKKEDAYMEHLAALIAEKLNPTEPVDTWVQDFQKADPNKYHQFKNKTPQKKAQMAVAAHYAANEPDKK